MTIELVRTDSGFATKAFMEACESLHLRYVLAFALRSDLKKLCRHEESAWSPTEVPGLSVQEVPGERCGQLPGDGEVGPPDGIRTRSRPYRTASVRGSRSSERHPYGGRGLPNVIRTGVEEPETACERGRGTGKRHAYRGRAPSNGIRTGGAPLCSSLGLDPCSTTRNLWVNPSEVVGESRRCSVEPWATAWLSRVWNLKFG